MENVYQFILDLFVSGGLIISVATFIIGAIVKQAINVIPNKYIPLIGGLIGIVLALVIPGIFPDKDIVSVGIYGLALGWSSTGGYETVKNLLNKSKEN